MYDIEELVGSTITMMTPQGIEFVGKLVAINDEETILTLEYPTLVINNVEQGNLMLQAFPSTAKNVTEIPMQISHILTLVETADAIVVEYNKIVNDIKERQNNNKKTVKNDK